MTKHDWEYAGFQYTLYESDADVFTASPKPGQHSAAGKAKHIRAAIETFRDHRRSQRPRGGKVGQIEMIETECDSFGYRVLTLDGLILNLQMLRSASPELGSKPVWLANCPPLLWPVKQVTMGRDGTAQLMVERGGN